MVTYEISVLLNKGYVMGLEPIFCGVEKCQWRSCMFVTLFDMYLLLSFKAAIERKRSCMFVTLP